MLESQVIFHVKNRPPSLKKCLKITASQREFQLFQNVLSLPGNSLLPINPWNAAVLRCLTSRSLFYNFFWGLKNDRDVGRFGETHPLCWPRDSREPGPGWPHPMNPLWRSSLYPVDGVATGQGEGELCHRGSSTGKGRRQQGIWKSKVWPEVVLYERKEHEEKRWINTYRKVGHEQTMQALYVMKMCLDFIQ